MAPSLNVTSRTCEALPPAFKMTLEGTEGSLLFKFTVSGDFSACTDLTEAEICDLLEGFAINLLANEIALGHDLPSNYGLTDADVRSLCQEGRRKRELAEG